MSPKDATPLDSLPVGRLGIIPLKSCEKLGSRVDDYIVKWRRDREHQEQKNLEFEGYERDSYLVKAQTPRFGSGEAKGILGESVRGDDIYVMVDVCNHSLTYSLCGHTNHMSPDDHFQDLKRVIAAIGGKAAWCASLEVEVCPFVTCAAETGVAHCGECGEFPCELYELTLSEDAGKEERRAFSMARYRNFGLLDAQRFLEKQSD